MHFINSYLGIYSKTKKTKQKKKSKTNKQTKQNKAKKKGKMVKRRSLADFGPGTFGLLRLHIAIQGPEEIRLSLEHQNPSKTSERWVILIALQFRYTFYRPQTKRLRARKIGLQYKIRKGRKQIWG